jgi:hypothetical protein
LPIIAYIKVTVQLGEQRREGECGAHLGVDDLSLALELVLHVADDGEGTLYTRV